MIDDRLSEELEAGARMIPMFSTDIVTTDGGWEVRNSLWEYPRYRFEFNLMPDETDPEDIKEILDMFNAAGGSAEEFLFTPWADYQGIGEVAVALTSTAFQITKNYTRGGITRSRKITRPKPGTVTVYHGGVEQVGGYTVDYDTGIITFSTAKAAQSITVDFDFDVLVRFMDDELELLAHTGELNQPVDITLIQVKE
jgi:uncharacterized protein (TIGR02217 family)